MAKLGLVALDGSKVRANSGVDTFRKLGEWEELLREAKGEAKKIIDEAESIDKEEDRIHGAHLRGDELLQRYKRCKIGLKK